jgi:hypothetical protein
MPTVTPLDRRSLSAFVDNEHFQAAPGDVGPSVSLRQGIRHRPVQVVWCCVSVLCQDLLDHYPAWWQTTAAMSLLLSL